MYNGFIPHWECNITRKILVMRAQSVRTGLLVLTVISIFLVSVITPAPVRAQTCTEYPGTDPDADGYYSVHITSAYGALVNFNAGDFFGWRFEFIGPASGVMHITYYDTSDVYGGGLVDQSTSFNYTIPVHTNALAVYQQSFAFTILVCTPVPPTNTPTFTLTPSLTPTITLTPSLTPSNTPTPTIMIEATVTPSPVPTPTPIDIALETQRIAIISYNAFLWFIGIGSMAVGLLMLSFLRVRL